MKVLIVNASDIHGGAAKAAYRLHQSLLDQYIDSQMIVQDKISDDDTVIGPSSKFQKGIAKIRPTLDSLPVRLYRNREKITCRRQGDPKRLVANNKNFLKLTEWKPKYDNLEQICKSALIWEKLINETD